MTRPDCTLRPACWPEDLPRLARLDTSFSTDRIYRLHRTELRFELREETIDPPFRKDYGCLADDACLLELEYAVVAEHAGEPVGFAAGEYAAWNRRFTLWHLYVARPWRGRGLGRALLAAVEARAREAGARCLWLETQNTNYPAVQFYQRLGFRLCGLDETLYDPAGPASEEVALFFSRQI